MPEPTLDELETVFLEVVAAMQEDDFDSHDFILRLAQAHQRLHVRALPAYADTNRLFQVVHGEIAKRLLRQPDLGMKTRETTSEDIFGQPNICATWHRVG